MKHVLIRRTLRDESAASRIASIPSQEQFGRRRAADHRPCEDCSMVDSRSRPQLAGCMKAWARPSGLHALPCRRRNRQRCATRLVCLRAANFLRLGMPAEPRQAPRKERIDGVPAPAGGFLSTQDWRLCGGSCARAAGTGRGSRCKAVRGE